MILMEAWAEVVVDAEAGGPRVPPSESISSLRRTPLPSATGAISPGIGRVSAVRKPRGDPKRRGNPRTHLPKEEREPGRARRPRRGGRTRS